MVWKNGEAGELTLEQEESPRKAATARPAPRALKAAHRWIGLVCFFMPGPLPYKPNRNPAMRGASNPVTCLVMIPFILPPIKRSVAVERAMPTPPRGPGPG